MKKLKNNTKDTMKTDDFELSYDDAPMLSLK